MSANISTAFSCSLGSRDSTSRKWSLWLARMTSFSFALGSGVASVAFGGWAAMLISPHFIDDKYISNISMTYGLIFIFVCYAKHIFSELPRAAMTALLAVLFLGVATRCNYDLRDLEALCLWFLIIQISVKAIDLLIKRVEKSMLEVTAQPRMVAFLGNSQSAATMLAQLKQDRCSHIQVIGFFDDRLNRPGPLTGLIPCLGTIDDLVGYIHDVELTEIYMALPWSAGSRISHLIEKLRFLPLTVRLVPDHVPPALPGRGDGQLYGVVMPTLMVPPFSVANAFLKRAIDVSAAAILLIPLIPLFIMVAMLLKLDSPGPIFFRQIRSGRFGRPFRIFKFRSLHVAQADAAAETLVVAGDHRVTRVGKIIRKYSIDELPQIFNVLLGQMSLVGPRPHAPRAKADGRIYAEIMPDYMMRYRVKPGMTGWAQVNGWRGNTDTEEQLRKRVEFDFQYIGKWSLWKDFSIILRTVPAMLLPPSQNV